MEPKEHQLYYLELDSEPLQFDSVTQLTNVFFDDTNKQVFSVRSGGATGVVVKGPSTPTVQFRMDDKGPIRSIKFSPDNQILAVQRTEVSVEFISFTNGTPNLTDIIVYKGKNIVIYGFVWLHDKEVALISNNGVEIFIVNFQKRQLKSIKSLTLTTNWFAWCPTTHFAVLASNNGIILTPVIIKQGTITKLQKIEWELERGVPERDVTLGQLYGTSAILILKPAPTRLIEVVIYLLNGPGLAPRKSHVLHLGYSGRFAMNIVDDLVIVHHQMSATSLIFDTALVDEKDSMGVTVHTPVTPGRPLKPFTLKVPSLALDGQTMKCELYSPNWVLFQPNIIIDAKLGCLWHVNLKLDSLTKIITDQVRLSEFLLHRIGGKPILLELLKEWTTTCYSNNSLPILCQIFDKMNEIYSQVAKNEALCQTAQAPTLRTPPPHKPINQPRVLIDQNDMFINIFNPISDTEHVIRCLMVYLQSLAKNGVVAQHDVSKMIIIGLIRRQEYRKLQQLITYSLLHESKALACFLLSMSNLDPFIGQMALDMLHKLNANEIIIEVLLGQGKVIDALRLAKTIPGADTIPARKYLEAAMKTNDPVVFHSVYFHFQQRNLRLRGSPEFMKNELCNEYIQHYHNIFGK